jgi:hypothetical protein
VTQPSQRDKLPCPVKSGENIVFHAVKNDIIVVTDVPELLEI